MCVKNHVHNDRSQAVIIKRATIGQALAQVLQDANGDVDQILAVTDQIANNVLGVCEDNTTAPEALCGAVTTDKSVNKA